MSVRIMSQIWENGPSKQGHLLVMLALADYSDDAGRCWPSVASIAKKARMTERGVQKIIRSLEESGWLKIDTGNGRHGCNQYTINHEPRSGFEVEKNPEPRSPRTTFTPNNDAETPNESAENPEPRSPEPSRTIKEPSKNSAREILASILSDETADDFISHRKAIKAPVTPQAAKALVKKCSGHPDPDSVFLESIANGWRGVFPERSKPKPGNLVNWEAL